jgi:hypothetical protein
MERVGNARANAYWEAALPPGVRPAGDDVETMTKFIRQKYELAKWADPEARAPHLPEGSGRRRRRHRPPPAADVELADPFDSLEPPQIRPDEDPWPAPDAVELSSVPREGGGARWTDRAVEGLAHIKEVVVSKIDELFDRRRRDDHIVVGHDVPNPDFGIEQDPMQQARPLFEDPIEPPRRRRRHRTEPAPPEELDTEPEPPPPPPPVVEDLIGLEPSAPVEDLLAGDFAAPPQRAPVDDLLDLIGRADDLIGAPTPNAVPQPAPVDGFSAFRAPPPIAPQAFGAPAPAPAAPGRFADWGLGQMMPAPPMPPRPQANFGVARPPPTFARELFGTAPPPPPPQMRPNRFAGLSPF